MNPGKEDLKQKINQWVELAEEDFRTAKHTLTMESNIPYRVVAFHSQQCAEKYIKALLVYHLIDFPYTHNIEKLLELIPPEYELAIKLLKAGDLTDYAVSKRYPDYYEKLTAEDALKAIELAGMVREAIKNIFLELGFTF